MATTSSLHLLVIFLCFSHLMISLTASIPITRGRILQAQEYEEPSNTHKGKMVKRWDGESMTMMRRMDVELNDYPGSGANHRHTPWAPPARACLDC